MTHDASRITIGHDDLREDLMDNLQSDNGKFELECTDVNSAFPKDSLMGNESLLSQGH